MTLDPATGIISGTPLVTGTFNIGLSAANATGSGVALLTLSIAAEPNVAAKVSGVVAYADPNWGVDDLRTFVAHVIESFGWDRVVWGSDWPVCTLGGGLSIWVAATHALTSGASADEKANLLSGNARRLWRL